MILILLSKNLKSSTSGISPDDQYENLQMATGVKVIRTQYFQDLMARQTLVMGNSNASSFEYQDLWNLVET